MQWIRSAVFDTPAPNVTHQVISLLEVPEGSSIRRAVVDISLVVHDSNNAADQIGLFEGGVMFALEYRLGGTTPARLSGTGLSARDLLWFTHRVASVASFLLTDVKTYVIPGAERTLSIDTSAQRTAKFGGGSGRLWLHWATARNPMLQTVQFTVMRTTSVLWDPPGL